MSEAETNSVSPLDETPLPGASAVPGPVIETPMGAPDDSEPRKSSHLSSLPSSDLAPPVPSEPPDEPEPPPSEPGDEVEPAQPADETPPLPEEPPLEPEMQEITDGLSEHSDRLGAMAGALAAIQDRLAVMEDWQVAVSRILQQVEQRLHDMKAENLAQSQRSLLKDILGLHDLAISIGQTIDARETIPVEEFGQRMSLMAIQIAQFLQLNGLELIETKPGDAFDNKLHYAREGVPCDDPEMHRTIKAVHQAGFRNGAFVFRPAAVDVWVSEKPPEEQTGEEQPAEEQPIEEKPAEEQPVEQTSEPSPEEPTSPVESDESPGGQVLPQ